MPAASGLSCALFLIRLTTMPERACTLLIRLTLLLLLGLLGACASSGVVTRDSVPQGESAEQLVEAGKLEEAAAEFLRLAETGSRADSAHYSLRAGETLRENGDYAGAQRAIADIRRKRLAGEDLVRFDLLDAEIALNAGDADRASALLAMPTDGLSPPLLARLLELQARAADANQDHFAAVRIRASLDALLAGADRDINRRQILEVLTKLDPDSLKAKAMSLRPDDALQPWIEYALRQRGQMLARDLPRPQRPVGTLLPDSGQGDRREGYGEVGQVAVLLPLTGQVAGVAHSILDGIFAAHFADAGAERPLLRVYDAGQTPQDAVAAYQKAVAEGARLVVGPLLREAVGELFRQQLPVRVLALNHPDSGEIPPSGSAEFALLPDAEGAQAAERMLALGIRQAAVIAATTDWAERASLAFRTQFEAGGGSIAGESRIADKDFNFKSAIAQAAGNFATRDIINNDPTIASQTAPPVPDTGVFISMRPQQARLLLPQLKLARVTSPVFATSHVNAGGSNPGADRDLQGVEFCDAAWLFAPVAGRPDRETMARNLGTAAGLGGRLFAFGMDAYALLPYLDWLLAHPDAYLDGASGQLAVDNFGRVHRLLSWARFSDGIAQPVQGALSPLPLQ